MVAQTIRQNVFKCWIKLKYLFNYALDGMIKGVCLAWWLAMDLTNMIVHACNYSILVNGELFTSPLSFSLLYFSSHLNPLIRRFSIRIRLELKEPIWCWPKHQEEGGGAQIEAIVKFVLFWLCNFMHLPRFDLIDLALKINTRSP